MLDDLILRPIRVIVGPHVTYRLGADRLSVFAEIDSSERIHGADMHDTGHAMLYLSHHQLGNRFPFVKTHSRALAIRTENKQGMNAAGHKPLGELAHELFIDTPVLEKNCRSRQNDPPNVTGHNAPKRLKNGCMVLAWPPLPLLSCKRVFTAAAALNDRSSPDLYCLRIELFHQTAFIQLIEKACIDKLLRLGALRGGDCFR